MPAIERIGVAAGILVDDGGNVLLTERIGDSPFAGLWEFPGGKIHSGETAAAAMRRELAEELGIVVQHSDPFVNVQHDYTDRCIALEFFLVTQWQGCPIGRDGQALQWRRPADIAVEELLPADAPVLRALQQKTSSVTTTVAHYRVQTR
jgi:8-oxo-dGTP diphosphatase